MGSQTTISLSRRRRRNPRLILEQELEMSLRPTCSKIPGLHQVEKSTPSKTQSNLLLSAKEGTFSMRTTKSILPLTTKRQMKIEIS
jgi:hypothetical protein